MSQDCAIAPSQGNKSETPSQRKRKKEFQEVATAYVIQNSCPGCIWLLMKDTSGLSFDFTIVRAGACRYQTVPGLPQGFRFQHHHANVFLFRHVCDPLRPQTLPTKKPSKARTIYCLSFAYLVVFSGKKTNRYFDMRKI